MEHGSTLIGYGYVSEAWIQTSHRPPSSFHAHHLVLVLLTVAIAAIAAMSPRSRSVDVEDIGQLWTWTGCALQRASCTWELSVQVLDCSSTSRLTGTRLKGSHRRFLPE